MRTYDHIVSTPEQIVHDAWQRVAGASAPQQLVRLLRQYSEPHRHYHTLAHLAAVLTAIHDIATHTPAAQAATDPDAVVLAALFHDAIYDPTSAHNEADSAELARACALQLGWPAPRCTLVAALVMATAGHVADSGADDGVQGAHDADEALLLDADLAILAASPEAYGAYAEAVRHEYAHVADAQWRAGRAAVLRRLLGRRPLFRTAYMQAEADAAARANLSRELATLTHP